MIIKGIILFIFGLPAMSSFPTYSKIVSAEVTAPRKAESRRTSAPVELL